MTQSEADVLAFRLENLGYGPVWIKDGGAYIRVFAGKCENYPDAYILKQSLRKNGFPDAFIKEFPEMVTKDFISEMTLSDEPLVLQVVPEYK